MAFDQSVYDAAQYVVPKTYVFSEPGNPHSELVAMRCQHCKETKQLWAFPPSVAVYRRGACRDCGRLKNMRGGNHPLRAKLSSAVFRFGRKMAGSLTLADVERAFNNAGVVEARDFFISPIDDTKPLTPENITVEHVSALLVT